MDINEIMIMIIGKTKDQVEIALKNKNFKRHVQYYRFMGMQKDSILKSYIMEYDSSVPFILKNNGFIVYESLSFNEKTEQAILFKPDELSSFQEKFLKQIPFEMIPDLMQDSNYSINKK